MGLINGVGVKFTFIHLNKWNRGKIYIYSSTPSSSVLRTKRKPELSRRFTLVCANDIKQHKNVNFTPTPIIKNVNFTPTPIILGWPALWARLLARSQIGARRYPNATPNHKN